MKENSRNSNIEEKNKKKFLIFSALDNFFALPMEAILEIIDPLVCTPLPFVPGYVDGLINVKGKVIPQINLQQLIFNNEISHCNDNYELLIIETSRSPCGLKIDSVIANASIDEKSFRKINKIDIKQDGAIRNDSVIGEFEWNGKVILVFAPFFFGELIDSQETGSGHQGLLGKIETREENIKIDVLSCLVVNTGNEKYALPLNDIVEIVQVDSITSIPGSPKEVKGIAMIREQALLVLSLSELLSRGFDEGETENIVIVECNNINYGLKVDGIEGIYYFDREKFQAVDDEDAELSGVLIAGNKNIIGLIKPEKIMSEKNQQLFSSFVPERREKEVVEIGEFKTVLRVTIGEEDYGIPLEDVKRISEFKRPEPVATKDNDFIIGAVDINGTILPVVDLTAGDQMSDLKRSNDDNSSLASGFVIVGNDERQWAVKIESAKEIIQLPIENIEKVTNSDLNFIVGIANIGEQLISVIDVDMAFNRV